MGTGSEVGLCMIAWEALGKDGVKARVVSMPSWELLARDIGLTGAGIGMKTFGASAPLKELQKTFGFTVEAVAAAATQQLARR